MYEFLSHHALYTVLVIVLICWIGIAGYIVRLDRSIAQLERSMESVRKGSRP